MSDETQPGGDGRGGFPWWVIACLGVCLATWAATANVRTANETIARTNQVILQNQARQQQQIEWQRAQQQRRTWRP